MSPNTAHGGLLAEPVLAEEVDDGTVEGPLCEKCGAGPVDLESWCSECGYYPRLGSYVDIEAEREIEEYESATYTEPASLWESIPAWAWKVSAALAGVVAFSIAGRLLTPEDSGPRALWSFSQFLVAFLAFAAAHIWAFVKASMDDSSLGCLDMLTKPLANWGPTIRDLPQSERRLILGSSGYVGVLCAFWIVGGMNYDRLFDWGIEPGVNQKSKALPGATVVVVVVGVVVVGGGGSSEDGEIDVNDVGSGLGGGTEEEDGPKAKTDTDGDDAAAKEDKLRPHQVDCIVIGYLPDKQFPERFDALVLAANIRGQLRAVGIVRYGIPAEARAEITPRLSELSRPEPIVPCLLPTALWLEDEIRCRIRFAAWTDRQTIRNPRFDSLLIDESQPRQP